VYEELIPSLEARVLPCRCPLMACLAAAVRGEPCVELLVPDFDAGPTGSGSTWGIPRGLAPALILGVRPLMTLCLGCGAGGRTRRCWSLTLRRTSCRTKPCWRTRWRGLRCSPTSRMKVLYTYSNILLLAYYFKHIIISILLLAYYSEHTIRRVRLEPYALYTIRLHYIIFVSECAMLYVHIRAKMLQFLGKGPALRALLNLWCCTLSHFHLLQCSLHPPSHTFVWYNSPLLRWRQSCGTVWRRSGRARGGGARGGQLAAMEAAGGHSAPGGPKRYLPRSCSSYCITVSLWHCVTVALCHCHCVTVSLSLCHCVTVTVSLSLCHCVTVTVSLSLCHCHCVTVTVSLSLCHCVTVTVSLCHCHCVTVTVSLSLCHCHCVTVTVSLCHCALEAAGGHCAPGCQKGTYLCFLSAPLQDTH